MRIKIGTFNVLNLVLPQRAYHGGPGYSPQEYDQKVQWIGRQLQDMDCDLVGFQEIFHQEALEAALKASGTYDKCQVFVAGETGDLPRVALVSRLPVRNVSVIQEFPEKARIQIDGVALPFTGFHRPILKALVALPNGYDAVVFVVHLKSKRPMVPEGRDRHDDYEEAQGAARSLMLRACEASALRHLILDEVKNTRTPVILLGDLNDSAHAVTSDILQGRLPQRTYPQDVKIKLWDTILYNCGDLQIRKSYKDVYYTHLHNSHYESLDHVLVSEEFVNENPYHIGNVEYMRLYHDHLLDRALTDEDLPMGPSDHGQVVVSLRLKETQKIKRPG